MAPPNAEREALFQRGLEAYREGQHYEAHELWEELWESEEADDHRRFLQALIQVASAVHKLKNNVGPRGSLRLLESALVKIEGLPDTYGGVALGRFREGVVRARREFESLIAQGRSDVHPGLIPPVDRVGDASS
jgi:predicted metal-dependent hydrolase